MKKFIFLIVLLLTTPFCSYANGDDDIWSYVFHLEYSGGKLSPEQGIKFPYDSIPVQFITTVEPNKGDFYGSVSSVHGKELARFGFMLPSTTNAALGKSLMDIRAPYYADADHVAFYVKGGIHLFDISVRGSSFCNDNGMCDVSVGENYVNCPLDCPAPIGTISPPSVAPGTGTQTSTLNPTPVTPQETGTPVSPGDTSYITTSTRVPAEKSGVDIKTILSFVGGILIIIFAFVLYRVQKHME